MAAVAGDDTADKSEAVHSDAKSATELLSRKKSKSPVGTFHDSAFHQYGTKDRIDSFDTLGYPCVRTFSNLDSVPGGFEKCTRSQADPHICRPHQVRRRFHI